MENFFDFGKSFPFRGTDEFVKCNPKTSVCFTMIAFI